MLYKWKGNRSLYKHGVFRWGCKCNIAWLWLLTGLASVSDIFLGVETGGWGIPCRVTKEGSGGSWHRCWKKWLFSHRASIPSLLLAQVFLLLPGGLKRRTGEQSGQAEGLPSAAVVPSQVSASCGVKVGASTAREGLLLSEAMQMFASLECLWTFGHAVCVWPGARPGKLEGYQSDLGCAWGVGTCF